MQNPANSQSWNRYTYVMNSPIQYVDPSGYDGLPIEGVTVRANSGAHVAIVTEDSYPGTVLDFTFSFALESTVGVSSDLNIAATNSQAPPQKPKLIVEIVVVGHRAPTEFTCPSIPQTSIASDCIHLVILDSRRPGQTIQRSRRGSHNLLGAGSRIERTRRLRT